MSRLVTRSHVPLAVSLRQIMIQQSIPLGLIGFFAVLALLGTTMNGPLVCTIAANIAMVAVALWLIRFGLKDRSPPFAAGVVHLLLWAVFRYVDLFGAVGGMLGASLLFFLSGGALMAVAMYWRNRKAVSVG
jgi:hypothetical protein